MLFRRRKVTPPPSTTPSQELAVLGPVVQHNHIAYVPSAQWSGVPGVGTANLAYVPDFLLSAPESVSGNAITVQPNQFTLVNRPSFVNAPKQVADGIGGITAGQIVGQALLEVSLDNTGTV